MSNKLMLTKFLFSIALAQFSAANPPMEKAASSSNAQNSHPSDETSQFDMFLALVCCCLNF